MNKLTVCLDANSYISGIGFGGKPLQILERALNRDFVTVTSPQILDEVRRNLLGKLARNKKRVDRFLEDMTEVSSFFGATER
ncbi:hypothetical protein WDW37_07715 [Bdellovibrionota bacterium FG-1]